MFPYYLLIFLPLVFAALPNKMAISYGKKTKIFNNKLPMIVFFVLFLFLLSVRSINCGVDLHNYKIKFDEISFSSLMTLFSNSTTEPAFGMLIMLSKLITNSYQFFLCVCAIISVVPIMVFYIKESNHSVLTMALFIGIAPFTIFFSGLRQSIAIGLVIICYHYCKEKKLVFFLLSVFLAFLFHQSAIILLLLYPLIHVRITKKWIIPIAAVYALCMIFNKQIFSVLLGFSDRYENRYVISETGSYTFLLLIMLFVIYSFVISEDNSQDLIGFRNILVISLLIQCFAPINTVAMRLNYYFLIFVPVAIPKFIDYAKENYQQIAKISLYVFVIFFICWFFRECYFGSNILHTVPYEAFWEV